MIEWEARNPWDGLLTLFPWGLLEGGAYLRGGLNRGFTDHGISCFSVNTGSEVKSEMKYFCARGAVETGAV